QTIHRAGDDIANIVSRMRQFYRQRSDTEQLVRVNINQLIEEVVELTRPRWRDLSQREGISIHIQKQLDPGLPLLLSDPSVLREALINLVSSAIDAPPRGGTITLLTRAKSTGNADSDVTQQLHVEIRDDGIGMDESTRERCLEPFFSTKTKRG